MEGTTDVVRDTVIRMFRDYGASEAEIAGMRDTHLIRDGHYCGRSFRTSQHLAMHMGSFIQFYGANGDLLAGITLCNEPRRQKAA
jgi:hypothetical protein